MNYLFTSKKTALSSLNSTEDLRKLFCNKLVKNSSNTSTGKNYNLKEYKSFDKASSNLSLKKSKNKNDFLKNDKIKKFLIDIHEDNILNNSKNYFDLKQKRNKSNNSSIYKTEQNSKIQKKINVMSLKFKQHTSSVNRPIAVIGTQEVNFNYYNKISPINTKIKYIVNGLDKDIKANNLSKNIYNYLGKNYSVKNQNISNNNKCYKIGLNNKQLVSKNEIDEFSNGFNSNKNNKNINILSNLKNFEFLNFKNNKFNKEKGRRNKSFFGFSKTPIESLTDFQFS